MVGRPRNVPESEAIERAVNVFWRKGYQGTSVSDLSKALGVGPSGLYNAFGSKEQLYRRAVEHYVARYTKFLDALDEDMDVPALVRTLLRGAARTYTDPSLPLGCLIMQSGGAASAEESRAAAITLEVKAEVEKKLKKGLVAAAKEHGTDLPASAAVLAKYLMTTMRGLSQMAIDGASAKDLRKVADVAARVCASAA